MRRVIAVVGVLVAGARIAEADPTRTVRADGMARFDDVALLEANTLCGTRAGHAPVCASDPGYASHAAMYEALPDVTKLESLGTVRCWLRGTGELRCHDGDAFAATDPARWPVVATEVVDFGVAAAPGHAFALGRDGTLSTVDMDGRATRIATDVRSFATAGGFGACAVHVDGHVSCTDQARVAGPLVPVPGFDRAVTAFYGGAIVSRDGSFRFAVPDMAKSYASAPSGVTDYGFQGICVLRDGRVACGGIARGSLEVALPAPAKRLLHGYAMCAVLADDRTLCWGPFRDTVVRLAARPDPPGAQLAR